MHVKLLCSLTIHGAVSALATTIVKFAMLLHHSIFFTLGSIRKKHGISLIVNIKAPKANFPGITSIEMHSDQLPI